MPARSLLETRLSILLKLFKPRITLALYVINLWRMVLQSRVTSELNINRLLLSNVKFVTSFLQIASFLSPISRPILMPTNLSVPSQDVTKGTPPREGWIATWKPTIRILTATASFVVKLSRRKRIWSPMRKHASSSQVGERQL